MAPSFSASRSHGSIVLKEFVSISPPTPRCHASTIVDTPAGLVAAWFGGKHERAPDVGIWLSRKPAGGGWSRPVQVANGRQPDGRSLPTWNPVLFMPRHGPLLLFYKVGPDPAHWWGMVMTSLDDGVHWSAPRRLPSGLLGPIKDKPVQLPDGSIVSPSSNELGGWHIHFELSDDAGQTWHLAAPVGNPRHIAAIQPSLLYWGPHLLQAIGRTKQNRVFSTWSHDGGRHWSNLALLDVRNPNSGIDAVMLRDGRALLVYNPTIHGKNWWNGRGTLAVALSKDGIHWRRVLTLEHTPGAEFSYPAVIQAKNGLVHIVYTWKRLRIRHIVLDPKRL
ncbi:sialidase family protein [Dyella sp. A6]|uniref:sialidase family protein n=1 Tax=Dyella aluminiiresistens TaxID=3069105 RepID=UPI002E75DC25|nr:sialidase family protein [Dyella sp. A6]